MATYYIDMDGVIANFHKEPYSYANACNTQWIANLEPFMYNVQIIKNLIKEGNEVFILSKAAHKNAEVGKKIWLKKYLPEIVEEKIIIIVGNGRKVDYIKTETGILIDDDKRNVNPWIKAGFQAILLNTKGAMIEI